MQTAYHTLDRVASLVADRSMARAIVSATVGRVDRTDLARRASDRLATIDHELETLVSSVTDPRDRSFLTVTYGL